MRKTIACRLRRDDHEAVSREADRLVTDKVNVWAAMRRLWEATPEPKRRRYLESLPHQVVEPHASHGAASAA